VPGKNGNTGKSFYLAWIKSVLNLFSNKFI
jgi:hypothetical protein